MINNTNNAPMIIIEKNHPLYSAVKAKWEVKSIDEALASFDTPELIIDLSILRTKKKLLLLKELSRTTKAKIVSDLTLCWGDYIFKTCPHVIGAVSLLFQSPTNAIEYAINKYSENAVADSTELITTFIGSLDKTGVLHKDLHVTFHYPRTIAMIINEAYFALDEGLASPSAIDLAMKNGVNYPLGPIEWGEKIGLAHVCELLQELHEITEDSRYRVSKELKLKSLTGTL